jgi:hypothetical protein
LNCFQDLRFYPIFKWGGSRELKVLNELAEILVPSVQEIFSAVKYRRALYVNHHVVNLLITLCAVDELQHNHYFQPVSLIHQMAAPIQTRHCRAAIATKQLSLMTYLMTFWNITEPLNDKPAHNQPAFCMIRYGERHSFQLTC